MSLLTHGGYARIMGACGGWAATEEVIMFRRILMKRSRKMRRKITPRFPKWKLLEKILGEY